MINVNTFKPGITFQENKDIFVVLDASHSKQGRGQANVKAKVKNLRSGSITVKSYTGGDKVSKAHISKRDMDYLYSDGTNIILMDQVTYEQIEIPMKKVKWELNFMLEGNKVQVRQFEKEVLDIELPADVTLKVEYAEDAVKGNSTSNPQKKIKLETGFEMEAPIFVKTNDSIIVSTVTGKYKGRNKK